MTTQTVRYTEEQIRNLSHAQLAEILTGMDVAVSSSTPASALRTKLRRRQSEQRAHVRHSSMASLATLREQSHS